MVNCNIPSCDIWKSLRELIWLPMSPMCAYLFHHTSVSNSKIKRAWAEVVKWWMTYRKVIRDTVLVRPKHGEISDGYSRVNKQWFRTFNGPIVTREWSPQTERSNVDSPLALAVDGWALHKLSIRFNISKGNVNLARLLDLNYNQTHLMIIRWMFKSIIQDCKYYLMRLFIVEVK